MNIFSNALVMIDLMSIIVELIILATNIAENAKNRKRQTVWFIHTDLFFLAATVTDVIWNMFNREIHNIFLAKLLASSGVALGTIGQLFLGLYIFELIEKKGILSRILTVIIGLACVFNVFYTYYGAVTGSMFSYDMGRVYIGDSIVKSLHMVIFIGSIEILFILIKIRTLKIRTTLIMLSYYVLPLFAISCRIINNKYDFIYPSIAASLLIINNLLITHEKELARTNMLIAEAAEKNKSIFLANMSHEIRTPINAVLGLNELILREAKDPTILGYANDIKSSGNQLLSLVNDVLDFSKIESGKMEIIPISYEISSMLNDIVNMTNIKAEQKGLSFRLDVDASIPRVLVGDEVRIKQIITNILSNAVKYTNTGWVRLSISYEKVEDFAIILRVTVEDTGIGMKQEDIENLFVPFQRIEEERNYNIEGTGLGMAISQNYLKLMNSELQVDSIYGNGAIFSFAVRQEVENWEAMGDYKKAFQRLRQKNTAYRTRIKAHGSKVLVVDDMPMNLTVVRGLLKETGVAVETATSGEEALELMALSKFDLVFLDHMMPGMDGIDTLKRLKSDKDGINYKTPVIVLTANAVSGARDFYMEAGFNDYLTKPINPERLEKALMRYLPEDEYEIIEAEEIGDITDSNESGEDEKINKMRKISGINVDDGIQAASDPDTYLIAAEEFTLSAKELIGKINRFFEEEDLENYTILVHGLKTAARLIGDNDLSEQSRKLEMAGKGGDIETIKDETPKILARFDELRKALEEIFIETKDESALKELAEDSLHEAIEVIKNALDDFDFDTVASVISQLDDYKIPEKFSEDYSRFKICMAEVNFDGMVEIINKYI